MRSSLFNVCSISFFFKRLFQIFSIDEFNLEKYFKKFFARFIIDLLSIVNREINAIDSVDRRSWSEINEFFRIIRIILADYASFRETEAA